MPNWTKPQQTAIEDEGGTLLISAAAGSGKTAVLVERAARAMTRQENPVDADRFLIVTFTNAAAEELRGRIAKRIDEEVRENPQNVFLRRQRLLLQRASICTIDSYCMQLVKENFGALGLPPEISVIDNAQLNSLRLECISAVLEEQYLNEDFRAFVDMYGRARTDEPAKDAVLQLYDYIHSMPSPKATLAHMVQMYTADCPLAQTAWGKQLLHAAQVALQSAMNMATAARSLISEDTAIAAYSDTLESDIAALQLIEKRMQSGIWDDMYKQVQVTAFGRLKAIRGCESENQEAFKKLRDEIKGIVKKLGEQIFVCTEEEFEQDKTACAPMIVAVARAVQRFEDLFYAAKLEKKMLEFSDFEYLALALLQNEDGTKTQLAQQISSRYHTVMIDEYQDTNALQNALYTCLANETQSNLFMVGDVKQSVYRFRKASPEIFIEKRDTFTLYDGAQYPATVILGHNFRSSRGVINGVNDVFYQIMSREVGEVAYNSEEALVAGVTDTPDDAALELHLVDVQEEGGGEPAYVAQLISDMIERRTPVRDKDGSMRPCTFGDFCILLRSAKQRAPFYASALAAKGMPCYAAGDENLLESMEIAPLLATLRIIDNPAQDVPLTAAMLSPMFGFTADTLTQLRAAQPKGTLYSALVNAEDAKARDFVAALRNFRNMAAAMPVDALCRYVLEKTGYFAAVGAMPMGREKRESLRSFVQLATGYAQNGTGGLSGFLHSIDSALEAGGLIGTDNKLAPKGVVNIMTIHKSKGLEFPVCILAECSKRFNLRDTTNHILLHPELGAGFNLRNPYGVIYSTAGYYAIKQRLLKESISEEMRVLYVALTRARDKMIITAAHKTPGKFLENLAAGLQSGQDTYRLQNTLNYAGWLFSAALLHPCCDNLRKQAGAPKLPLFDAAGTVRAAVAAAPDALQQVQQEEQRFEADTQLVQQLQQLFAQTYARAQLATVPRKVSVSSLAKSEHAHILKRPSFMYSGGLSAAERGTAMHSFLQYANFAAAQADLQGELERLIKHHYMQTEVVAQLDEKRIDAFLQGSVAQRINTAQQALREYPFITAIPAGYVDGTLPPELQAEPVMVQGIADCVLINGDTAEIIDYKTDRGKTEQDFINTYRGQLWLYKLAVEKRLNVTVTKCTIYSLVLEKEIDVV